MMTKDAQLLRLAPVLSNITPIDVPNPVNMAVGLNALGLQDPCLFLVFLFALHFHLPNEILWSA